MKINQLHPWNISPKEAIAVQRRLASQVSQQNEVEGPLHYIAGLDISPEDHQGHARGAAVVISWPGLELIEVQVAEEKPPFPYIPGLLAFREAPIMASALERLSTTPDLILVDGQGLAHPRRFGIACHIGLLTSTPTIGCAKSILTGHHGPLGDKRGDWAELTDHGQVVGAALRTKDNTSPVYISMGHRIDLSGAMRWALACGKGYRIPEPTRLAHLAAAGKLNAMADSTRGDKRRLF